jgi:hypothetical protein
MSGSSVWNRSRTREDTKKTNIGQMKQKIGWGTVQSVAPTAYGALKTSLKVSVKALEKVPVPGLRAAAASLLAVLKTIEVS